MSKVVAKTEDEMIAAIEAQTKQRRIASEARQEQKKQELSLMYGSIDSHGESVDPGAANMVMPWELEKLSYDWCGAHPSSAFQYRDVDLSGPTESLKLSPPKPKIDYTSLSAEQCRAMIASAMSIFRPQSLTVKYIQTCIEKNAPDVLPMHVFEDMAGAFPCMVIATHKPVPDEMKRHFDSLRTFGTMIDYQQYLFACVPWPDPATAKSLDAMKALKAAAASPIPPKTTAAPVAAPAAPATKAFPTNALKHSWTKPGSAR